MNYMGRTILIGLIKIIVEQVFDVGTLLADTHRQYIRLLINDNNPAIFINDMEIRILMLFVFVGTFAHFYRHARLQLKVEMRFQSAINSHTIARKNSFGFSTADTI